MKCIICKSGETHLGFTTVTLAHKGGTVVIRNVPADVCDLCGEYYLDEEATKAVMGRSRDAEARGSELEIVEFEACRKLVETGG